MPIRGLPRALAFLLVACAGGTATRTPPPGAVLAPPAPREEVDAGAGGAVDVERDLAAFRDDATRRGFAVFHPLGVRVPLQYALDGAEVRTESLGVIEAVAGLLQAHPQITRILVAVHAAATGSYAHNVELTKARALWVARWLREHGIDCRRIVPVGYGASRPIEDAGPAVQRRTELVVVAVRGRAVDGDASVPIGDACDGDSSR